MTSRFDRPDPGTAPAYCAGLEPDDDSNSDPDVCPIDSRESSNDFYPYCSAVCAIQTQDDSPED